LEENEASVLMAKKTQEFFERQELLEREEVQWC
jgi:hypothetical protein